MSFEPKLHLYSEALCVGDRPELSAILGQRVAIIARSLGEDGNWKYTVSAGKTSTPIVCLESELVEADPIPLVSDEEQGRFGAHGSIAKGQVQSAHMEAIDGNQYS